MEGAASPVPGRHDRPPAAGHDLALRPPPVPDLDALLALLDDRRLLLLAAPLPGASAAPVSMPPTTPRQLAITTGRADPEAMALFHGGVAVRAAATATPADAATLAIDALDLAAGRRPWHGAALPLVALALAAARADDHATVARLHAGVRVVQAEVALALSAWADRYFGAVRRAREALGARTFEALVAGERGVDAGPTDTWPGSLAFARAYAESLRIRPRVAAGWTWAPAASDAGLLSPTTSRPSRPPYAAGRRPDRPPEHLTPRELDVLRELAQGHTNNEIGLRLGLRPKTVMHHSVSIYAKLGVRGRAEATAWAFRNGVMEPAPTWPPTPAGGLASG